MLNKTDLIHKVFHVGSSSTITTFSENRIYSCKEWTVVEEMIQQLQSMVRKKVGEILYSTDVLIGSF